MLVKCTECDIYKIILVTDKAHPDTRAVETIWIALNTRQIGLKTHACLEISLRVKDIHVRIEQAFLNGLLGVDNAVFVEVLKDGFHIARDVALRKGNLTQQ